MMKQTGEQLPLIDGPNPLSQTQDISIPMTEQTGVQLPLIAGQNPLTQEISIPIMEHISVQLPSVDEQNPLTHHQQQQQQMLSIPQTGVQLPSIDEQNPLIINSSSSIITSSVDNPGPPLPPPSKSQLNPVTRRLTPNLPSRILLVGPRVDYLRFCVPLYEASIVCDWKAAREIIDEKPELVRYSITENGETALHVAASAKGPKHLEQFVNNLVGLMREEDLALENENYNTALYLAAAAGNIETVKIMAKKNMTLLKIPGAKGQMMPLYVAALFGHYKVVKFLYENSKELCDEDGWTNTNRGWLLEKCVEADMFDVALEIVKKYPKLGNGNILGILARKPEAFHEAKSNFMGRIIMLGKRIHSLMFNTHQPTENKHPEPGSGISVPEDLDLKPEALTERKSNIMRRTKKSVYALFGLTKGAYEKEGEALQLLKIIWEDIAQSPKRAIDNILRGAPDSIVQDTKLTSEKVAQVLQLRKLLSEHLYKLDIAYLSIIKGPPDVIKQDAGSPSGKVDQALQLHKLISEHLVHLHVESQNMIKQDNKPISGEADEALELQKVISKHIVDMHVNTKNIVKRESREEDRAKYLQKLIAKHITKMRAATLKESHSSRILFIAAEMGNTKFLVELIRRYPDLIWKVNDNNQTIFHVAVQHRHEGIYNLLYEIGTMKDLITPLRDPNENNMLHLAGKSTKKKRLEDVSGAALQMQRELLWFKEVRDMVPPSYRERKNKDGLTPRELFTEEHIDLITEGEKWMKGTASQCMVVATLIATIVFAAAFTVPGGYTENNGIPVFYRKATFVVFVVADAISLFLSSASILTFLSILTSRYAERDFVEALPKKLMLGLATLFLSITTMMVTFSISFFILYHKEMKWIPILLGVLAVSPVLLYVMLQYHLLIDVIRSTYGSKYLFKPQKRVLYYVKPRV